MARQNEAERVLLDAVYDIASHDRFDAKKMMLLLRQKDYRVCRGCDDPFPTQGSQVCTFINENISKTAFSDRV